MAPGPTQTANRGAAGRRSVVPVIPLPYVRRPKPQPAETTAAINGSSLKIQHNVDAATPAPNAAEVSKKDKRVEEPEETVLAVTKPESTSNAPLDEPTPPPTETERAETNEETKAPKAIDNLLVEEPSQSPQVAVVKPNAHVSITDGAPAPVATIQPPPAVPPSRYTLPPAFNPTGRPIHPLHNKGPRPGMNGPAHLHHPRPSNGSLQFGGFGSDRSSPAPPHSAGFGPPPGFPLPHDGRPPFQAHGHTVSGHGYPQMMPYGKEFVPVTGPENYQRHQATPSGIEAHFPGNNYGQTTPLSYQGSSSPNHPDDSGTFGQYNPGHGPNGHRDEHGHRHQASQGYNGAPHMMHGHLLPPHMQHPIQEAHGTPAWMSYLQSQFQDTAFSDCTVELRHADDRSPPVQLPGHRIVLAQSSPIRSILRSSSFESSPSGQPKKVILLVSEDRFLRSDAFWMAVQRLYGFPLLEIPEPQATSDPNFTIGNADSRFDFALAYAAAGHLLEWPSVLIRGIQIAAHHVSWTTLEKAIDFVLTDLPERASIDRHTRFHYGEAVRILIDAIINFIISYYPAWFRLDPSVDDPEEYARIPPVATAPPAQMNGVPVAHRSPVQLNHVSRSRPTHIKFGDMSESQANGFDGGQISPQERSIQLTLSRVLLNLPFSMFKPIFDYAESSFQNAQPVLVEREARRLRAIDTIVHGRIAGAPEIRRMLRSVEPQQSGPWHILGWQEEMVPYNKDTPSLGRQWQPLAAQDGEETQRAPETSRPSYP